MKPLSKVRAYHLDVNPRSGVAKLVRPKDAPSLAEVDLHHRVSLDSYAYVPLAAASDIQLASTAVDYMQAYIEQMAPRSPSERMLAAQMLWQHARIADLVRKAQKVWGGPERARLDAAIDSAMNVARRQALAWDQMRSPRSVQHIERQQINMAGQQVVANGPVPERISGAHQNVANEQGFSPPLPAPEEKPASQVSPDKSGAQSPPRFGAGGEAVDQIDRPSHDGRKGPILSKRASPRSALRGSPRRPPGNPRGAAGG